MSLSALSEPFATKYSMTDSAWNEFKTQVKGHGLKLYICKLQLIEKASMLWIQNIILCKHVANSGQYPSIYSIGHSWPVDIQCCMEIQNEDYKRNLIYFHRKHKMNNCNISTDGFQLYVTIFWWPEQFQTKQFHEDPKVHHWLHPAPTIYKMYTKNKTNKLGRKMNSI